MNEGIVAELAELIALRRYVQQVRYRPEKQATHIGNHLSKLRGRGMDFAEVRNYQAGDEVRHMEWRVTARTGRPHIKLYQEERERPAIILADFNPSMYFGTRMAFKSVIAARLAAMIAWTAIAQGDRVGGLLFSSQSHNEFVPRNRETGVLPFLASLSEYTQAQSDSSKMEVQVRSLSHALLRLRRVARPGSILVLISDFYNLDEESEQHLSRLRAHNDILAYHVCDPLELAPPKPQQYAITNGRREIVLDTTLDTVNSAYHHYCQQRIASLKAMLKRMQIQYVQVTGELDLPLLVRQTYPRRVNA
ncbi:DUF58 domain-containing protein [Legionella oakridgensis]|uniref:DUF58 domain-containing protein n=2 Tax=Legionella oakridgensis TaxID=29423 RepID=W0BIU3_9GAMM|nr:DUF58 domain-containing protein [Legionella oakridgensis]AHE68329.1 hypothetical protein Loa_02799 [Legionella oakridgensis ATCC 33761 = DSM 21215]ETO92191.1 hypothetical protein LOR_43c06290 [Legionella oakridgensis RV-2-2007]KTD38999.1 hypothetical protein Loak_1120 [Legionella oakridgensis]STY21273.1 Uncharacterized conserved protein (some members contain a von Willebrand factor type A (vWA) domain) [Legionella longbeachae]